MRTILFALIFSMLGLGTFAQSTTTNHKVMEGETLYRLSRNYKVSVAAIKAVNPQITGNNIRVGQVVTIPAAGSSNTVANRPPQKAGPAVPSYTPSNNSGLDKLEPVKHVVQKGETLYSISRSYNQNIDAIRTWNNIDANNIVLGQHLTVGWMLPNGAVVAAPQPAQPAVPPPPAQVIPAPTQSMPATAPVAVAPSVVSPTPIPAPNAGGGSTLVADVAPTPVAPAPAPLVNKPAPTPAPAKKPVTTAPKTAPKSASASAKPTGTKRKSSGRTSIYERTYNSRNSGGFKSVRKEGISEIIDDSGLAYAGSTMVIFHRTAPVHSIVKVTNPVNNRSVYLKVLRHFPSNGVDDKVISKIPRSVAKKLNVRDSRPRVITSYHVPK